MQSGIKRAKRTAIASLGLALLFGWGAAGPAGAAASHTAYIANWGAGTVTPIDTATNAAGPAITVGSLPVGIAITPDGKTAYVANYGSNAVTPIDTAANTAGAPISVGSGPTWIAITPDGKTAYVANYGSNTLTPITTATNTPGSPIPVGSAPIGIAITPDGKTAYVANSASNTLTPITTATNTPGSPIPVGSAPTSVAITPDGASAYVTNSGLNTLTPITVATNIARSPITTRNAPWGIAITPDGASAYVTDVGYVSFSGNTTKGSTTVSGIASTARLTQGMTVTGSGIPFGTTIAAPPGTNSITLSQPATATASGVTMTAWEGSTVMPVNLSTQLAGSAIGVATWDDIEPAITPDQAPVAAFTSSVAAAGTPTLFDASASTVAAGTITSYAWNFGDGSTATTATPTTAHTYAAAGTYTATLTETDSAGTSTTRIFTGQTVSRNGGASAYATMSLSIPSPTPATPGTTGPTAQRRSPAVVISARSLTLTARGDVVIHITCPASALGGCRGRITIRLAGPRARRAIAFTARCARGCRTLGRTSYEARAGQRVRLRVHIASFGRKLLARHGTQRVTLTATTTTTGMSTATSSRTTTLRAHRRRR
jgi:YVTN family beta-propeller protein